MVRVFLPCAGKVCLLVVLCAASAAWANELGWGYNGWYGASLDVYEEISGGSYVEYEPDNSASRLEYQYPRSAGQNASAYADPAGFRCGAYGVVDIGTPTGSGGMVGGLPVGVMPWSQDRRLVDVDVSVVDRVVVGAGSSGLGAGDPVTLRVRLRVDGHVTSGATGANDASATGDIWGGLRIVDPTVGEWTGGEEGFIVERAVDFGFWAEVERYYCEPNWYDANGCTWYEFDGGWQLSTNLDPDGIRRDLYQYVEDDDLVTPVALPPGIETVANTTFTSPLDSGWLEADFRTYVGAELEIEYDLSIFLQNWTLASYLEADFLDTFELSFETVTPGVAVSHIVPEPATLALLALALRVPWLRRS